VFVVVLQVGPRRLAAQSAFVRHPTMAQSPVVVLYTAGTPKPAQSALVVHLMAGQSVLVGHPQWATGPAPTPPGMQVAPAGLPAQSAFVTQPTQRPVDVLQVVACCSVAQSELDVQAATHLNAIDELWDGQVSPAGQSALVAQPHSSGGSPSTAIDLHTLPSVDVAQSASAAHPQKCPDVLQVGPRGLAAQSALVAHIVDSGFTQRPVVLSHAGPARLPVQSALLAQALVHRPLHTWPLAQSAIVRQLQADAGAPPPIIIIVRGQYVPPAAWAQSAWVEHPHVCVVVSHTGPAGCVAQSAFALHAFSHWKPKPPCAGQTDPVGHPLIAVQPHLLRGMPATTAIGPWHMGPEADDAQSESKVHTQACIRVLQRGPSALVAQSAFVLQPVDASTPPSPDGNVVLERLHPHRASIEMIPATMPPASLTRCSDALSTLRFILVRPYAAHVPKRETVKSATNVRPRNRHDTGDTPIDTTASAACGCSRTALLTIHALCARTSPSQHRSMSRSRLAAGAR
jgi:hypothetical protein